MKVTADLLNLPVICIVEGIEFGKIRGFIIDPDDGGLKYLAIENECWYSGAQLLPFDKIMGIGIDAVTTQTVEDIVHYNDEAEAQRLAGKGISIINSKVYTKKGFFVGVVDEFFIDEEDGRIIGCRLKGQTENRIITAAKIITYGKNVLIVEEGTQDSLLSAITYFCDEHDSLTEVELQAVKHVPEIDTFINDDFLIKDGDMSSEGDLIDDEDNISYDDDIREDDEINDGDDIEDDGNIGDYNETVEVTRLNDYRSSSKPGSIPNLFASYAITDSERISEEPENKAAKLFEQRQRKFLVGRKASKKITTDEGEIIIEDGQVVTDDIIDIIKDHGKLIELTMNTKA